MEEQMTEKAMSGDDERGRSSLSLKEQGPRLLYALTVFVGAFLLFQVQPLFGKYILPWFGGSPEVWTTCLLCFQVFLLGGYAYAHLIVTRLGPSAQAKVNIGLTVAALLALLVASRVNWKPHGAGSPILQIMFLFTGCIGLPYLVLSSTGPLMQNWFSRTYAGRSPYRLYAFSNAGSLIALVSYPFVVEPALSRRAQAQVWSGGLVLFAILSAWCARRLWKKALPKEQEPLSEEAVEGDIPMPSRGTRLLWLALPAGACVELLAVTNKICQDIAVIPFLWILPLSLYLLSFIICFHHERWYVRPLFLIAFIVAIGGAGWARIYEEDLTVFWHIAFYCGLLFACCMVCHGELYRLRPPARYLTRYYLMIAAGGAIGGAFVAIIAPLIFNAYRELHVGILVCCLFVLLADRSSAFGRSKRRVLWIVVLLAVGTATLFVPSRKEETYEKALLSTRNFFGVLTIWEEFSDVPAEHRYTLQHGSTFHGLQLLSPGKRLRATSYYSEKSGVGLALRFFPREQQRRIGVVGLGVGTVATYGKEGDYIRFYEINPAVKQLAETWFTFLENCEATVDIVMGDARLSMEGEDGQDFDVLVLDAFNSDVVPVHLLTKEAFEIYLRHTKADGVIALHVSSRYLDLKLVVLKLAEHLNLRSAWIENTHDDENGVFESDWILLTKNEKFLNVRAIRRASNEPDTDYEEIDLWTDDHVNVFQILGDDL
jgi:spermidine synthase